MVPNQEICPTILCSRMQEDSAKLNINSIRSTSTEKWPLSEYVLKI